MRIVQVAKHYPPDAGGIERLTQFYAEGLAAAGHDVEVIAIAKSGSGGIERPRRGLVVHSIKPSIAFNSGHFSRHYLRLVHALSATADVVHVHEPNPLATFGVVRTSVPGALVVSWHGDIIRQRLALPILKPLQRRVLARADAVCVLAASLIETSYALPGVRDKCTVLPTGIDPAPFEAACADDATIAAIRAEMGGPFVLAAGRLASYKGFDVLLRALAPTRLRAVIAGQGGELHKLQQLAAELGLNERVIFAGGVDDTRLRQLYAACEVFVLPSITSAETFGLVQLEAMACGKPVINTRLATGVPEVSLDGVTGLTVVPGDHVALGGALSALMGDSVLREKYGRAATQRIADTYSTTAVLQALDATYRRALAQRGLRAD